MKDIWTASDNGKVKEIIFALEQLEDEKMISYSEEIRWLKNLQDRFDE